MLYKQLKLRLIVAPQAKFYSESSIASASVPGTTVEWSKIKPFSEIPGPRPLPIVRNIPDFRRNCGRLIYYLEECYEKYGEIFKLEVPGQYIRLHVLQIIVGKTMDYTYNVYTIWLPDSI